MVRDSQSRRIRWISRTALLFALTLVIQMLGLPQFFTGPLVNAILLLAVLFDGVLSGVVIGLFTPWVAFSRGILPPPLGPMIPFIMIGNATLVIVFGLWIMKRKNLGTSIAGIATGSVIKYLILSRAVIFVVEVPPPVAQIMQTPQLITALVGGAIALLVDQALKRVRI